MGFRTALHCLLLLLLEEQSTCGRGWACPATVLPAASATEYSELPVTFTTGSQAQLSGVL